MNTSLFASVLCVALTVTAAAQSSEQPSTVPPAPSAAKPTEPEKTDPKLLPWRDRVPPRQLGIALGYVKSVERALELVVESHPELADRVKAIRERREKWLGEGTKYVEGRFREMGLQIDEIVKTEILTPAQDDKLRELIKADVEAALEGWGDFEKPMASIAPVSLLCSLDQAQEKDPLLALKAGLLTTWAGSRQGSTDTLKIEVDLPAGWNHGPATADNILVRMANLGGFGHGLITIVADELPATLSPEQELEFWVKMLDKSQFDKPGLQLLALEESKVGGRKAVTTTITATAKVKVNSRVLIHQVAFLEGRWAITVQLLHSEYTKLGDDVPPEGRMLEDLKKFDPVWQHLVGTMRIGTSENMPSPDPSAQNPAPEEKK